MNKYADFAKENLLSLLDEMSTAPWLFVKNPHADFTRKRKALIQKNILPVRPGRKDTHKVKTKSAVSFLYRVA